MEMTQDDLRSRLTHTDSLYTPKTAGVSAGDEVIVPAFSFIASASVFEGRCNSKVC